MTDRFDAEIPALRIILSNVLARLVVLETAGGGDLHDRLAAMND